MAPHPDLLVFKLNPKTFLFVEVKRDADRLSSVQKQFSSAVTQNRPMKVS